MRKYNYLGLVVMVAGLANCAMGQTIYKIEDTRDINMKLSGTSTLHKWEMDASKVEGEAQFGFKNEKEKDLISVKSLSFTLAVKDLKSDSEELDKNAWRALKSDEHKDIRYKLTSGLVLQEKGEKFLVKAIGKLTVAGVTREILMDVHCIINESGTIRCMGSYKMNMSDYNVKPPTFLLGAMKTGDSITLEFVVVFKKEIGA